MRHLFIPAALAGVLLANAAYAAPATVSFVDPDHYPDMPASQIERERVLGELRQHIDRLAARLPAGQHLSVEVLDLDLAGTLKPASTRPDLRVLTGGADWPRMHLRYRLEQDGKVLLAGDDQLADMAYLEHMNRYPSSTSLRYEKQMLDDWFKNKLKPG
jgi:hypothetical protein